MSPTNMSDIELIRHVDNMQDAPPILRELANRLQATLDYAKELEAALNSIGE